MNRLVINALSVVLFATACGGGSSVELVGKSPQQQAEAVAGAACEQTAECGNVSINCTSGPDGTDCTGTIEPVDYDACYADEYSDILSDFENCELTAAQEQTLEDCINAITAQSCVSQSELDAYVAEIEAGNEDVELRPIPPACLQAGAIFESCTPS